MELVERTEVFPALAVILSWLHALLTWFAVITYPYPEVIWTKRLAMKMAICEALPGITVCAFGTIVAFSFLLFLLFEYRRTPLAVRTRLSVRAAYLSAALLLLSCAMAWDNVHWCLILESK